MLRRLSVQTSIGSEPRGRRAPEPCLRVRMQQETRERARAESDGGRGEKGRRQNRQG